MKNRTASRSQIEVKGAEMSGNVEDKQKTREIQNPDTD